jgi:hypothetical protein
MFAIHNQSKIIKPFVLHLIGNNININKASNEFLKFSHELDVSSTIIDNKKVNLFNSYLTNKIIINKCYNIENCNEIKYLHDFTNFTSFYSYNSFAIYIVDNDISTSTPTCNLKNCIYISDLYDLNLTNYKKKLIFNNLFIDY